MFLYYIAKQPKIDIKSQLKDLLETDMLKAMFPNLSILANICMSIPVETASVEQFLTNEDD